MAFVKALFVSKDGKRAAAVTEEHPHKSLIVTERVTSAHFATAYQIHEY